ncbi:MAG TPA: hypothetical protein VFH85_02740, partial [Gammaproteobacteria bacterium]|nr:hypothetical protein [Gammaproteobacteria bacterium]
RRVNMLMDRALLYGYLEELHFIDRANMKSVIDEMDEEMGGEPAEAAAESFSPPPAMTAAPAAGAQHVQMRPIEEQIEALDRKLNFLLKSMNRRVVPGPGNRRNGSAAANGVEADELPRDEELQYRQSQDGSL